MRHWFLSSALVWAVTFGTATACEGPEYEGFDFWLGDWTIEQRFWDPETAAWTTTEAETSVSKVLDGCAVLERWRGRVTYPWAGVDAVMPLKGLSLRYWVPEEKGWHIYWMDSHRPVLGGGYVGTIRDGRGEFYPLESPSESSTQRIVFDRRGPDRVFWHLDVSRDAGETWLTVWEMHMTRRSTEAAETAPWRQAFATSVAGGRVAYYETPEAPDTVPLVVISGGPGSDHRYMHAGGAFDALARQRRVVMFDQRATGASSPAPAEPTIDQWLADIEAVREALGVETIDLLGHSFGGYLAMSYAVEHRERVRSLVLVDSAAPDPQENVQLLGDLYPERVAEWAEVRAGLSERFPAEAIALFFSMEFVDPAWLERYLEHVSGSTYDISVNNALRRDMERRALAERIDEITRPVLVLHGRFDAVLAPVTSWKIHRQLADSRFQVIEQSGHMPFVERPEEFVASVGAFLAQVEAAGTE